MKKIYTLITKALIVATLVISWANVQALESYERVGRILSINPQSSSINVEAVTYRLSPGLIVGQEIPEKSRLSDLRAGDLVFMEVMVLDNVRYAKRIQYLVDPPT